MRTKQEQFTRNVLEHLTVSPADYEEYSDFEVAVLNEVRNLYNRLSTDQYCWAREIAEDDWQVYTEGRNVTDDDI
jgi:hypothetical protein